MSQIMRTIVANERININPHNVQGINNSDLTYGGNFDLKLKFSLVSLMKIIFYLFFINYTHTFVNFLWDFSFAYFFRNSLKFMPTDDIYQHSISYGQIQMSTSLTLGNVLISSLNPQGLTK